MTQKPKHKKKSRTQKRWLPAIFLVGCGAALYLLLARLGLVMSPQVIPNVFCGTACQPEPRLHPVLEGSDRLNDEYPLSELLGEEIERDNISILVEKSKYRLTVFYNLQPIKSYAVVFGSKPKGDKLHEGDRKTPEGIYPVRDLYPHRAWSKFIWLDYPTPQSWRKHLRAKQAGQIDARLPIGGQIGIHGVPAGEDALVEERSNWTLGCISLKNRDVDEIYRFVRRGTQVEILP